MKPLVVGKRPTLRFNMLIVGPSGLGKRTFLKTLFQAYVTSVSFTEATAQEITLFESMVFTVEGDTSNVEFHVFESKGFGKFHLISIF